MAYLTVGTQGPLGGEVTAHGDTTAVHRHQSGGENRRALGRAGTGGVEDRLEVPVLGRGEGDTFAFTLHDQTGRHGLHPAGRELRHDLLPQHGRNLVAVETVQDAPCLLGTDQAGVQVTGVVGRALDGFFGDLVEHHAADRDLGFEFLTQMPGDGLTLTVLVRGEQEFVRLRHELLELLDVSLLVGVDDIQRLEVTIDVHTEAGPGLSLVLGGNLRSLVGQVTDVPDAGLNDVAAPQITCDGPRLGRRLDDDEGGTRPLPFGVLRAVLTGAALRGWHALPLRLTSLT